MIMVWEHVRRVVLTIWPLSTPVFTVLATSVNGVVSMWETWLVVAVALATGIVSAMIWRSWAPQAGAPTGPRPQTITIANEEISLGIPLLIGRNGDEPCAGCGKVHTPVICVPLPDGSALVAHQDGAACDWATHVPDVDRATAALRLHEEFQCAMHLEKS